MTVSTTAWQLLALADVAATPWRNGGGVTRELLSGPTSSDWCWRLSVADVAANGPFSRFEHTQRWFAVLEGAGVVLRFAQATHRLDAHSDVLAFEGEWPCDCDLIDGATLDFNLMTRGLPAHMQRVRAQTHAYTPAVAGLAAVFSLHDETRITQGTHALSVPCYSLAWRMMAAHDVAKGTAQDTAQDTAQQAVQEAVQVHSPHALWLFIEGAA
jgi:environmental stress-induced protein Ves